MYETSMLDYFVFWSVVSLILTILGGLSLFYLFSLLRDIKRTLSRIETLLTEKKR